MNIEEEDLHNSNYASNEKDHGFKIKNSTRNTVGL